MVTSTPDLEKPMLPSAPDHEKPMFTSTLDPEKPYSGSLGHTTRRGRASCSLWYAPVANVCDLLLFLDENRVIPDLRHF